MLPKRRLYHRSSISQSVVGLRDISSGINTSTQMQNGMIESLSETAKDALNGIILSVESIDHVNQKALKTLGSTEKLVHSASSLETLARELSSLVEKISLKKAS